MKRECTSIDVVIPVYNNWAALQVLLDPMRDWISANKAINIIVVDDGSGIECDKVLAQLDGIPQVSVVRHAHNKGRSSAINTGCRYGASDYIAILDVDCVPDGHWLETFYRHMEQGVVGVFGNLRANGSGYWSRYLNEVYESREREYQNGSLDFVTAFCMFKREVFEHLGGFSEDYNKYGFEDRDFVQRIVNCGCFDLKFVKEIFAVHSVPSSIDGVLKKSWESGYYSSLLFSCRFPEFYRKTGYWYVDARQHTILYCMPLFVISIMAGRNLYTVRKLLGFEILPYRIWRLLVKGSSALAFFQGTYCSKVDKNG